MRCAAALRCGRAGRVDRRGFVRIPSPDAQNRLLDHVTDLSAPGSRLALEAFLGSADRDSARVEEMIRTATRGWREHGFHLDIWALNYAGPRHEVSGYLDNHGWRSVGTTTAQLLAAHDLPAAPALPAGLADRPNYWTCVLG